MMGSSPLGPLSDSTTRRLLIDLISTMNASFPDHDFSGCRPEQFTRELHVNQVKRRVCLPWGALGVLYTVLPLSFQVVSTINRHLAPLSETYNSSFLEELWLSIEEVVKLQGCEVRPRCGACTAPGNSSNNVDALCLVALVPGVFIRPQHGGRPLLRQRQPLEFQLLLFQPPA